VPEESGAGKSMDLTINLRQEGEKLLDLLKATIRQWQSSPWPHERERAQFAGQLYQRCLAAYTRHLEEAKARAEGGFNLEVDRRLVKEMEEKLAYWQRKWEELTGSPARPER
jgi:hypothetical protein